MANTLSASVVWHYHRFNVVTENEDDGQQTVAANINGSSSPNSMTNTNIEYSGLYVTMGSATNITSPCIVISSGGITGAGFIPYPIPVQGSIISGGFINTYEPTKYGILKLISDIPSGFQQLSVNGQYFEDNDGNWRSVTDDSVVATVEQVSNLPDNVDFNGWLDNDSSTEIIHGSDGHYYNTDGEMEFRNLPTTVTLHSTGVNGLYEGDDHNYYDSDGNQILDNLPSNVDVVDKIDNNVYQGNNGSYYDIDGNQTLSNLPGGVTITGSVGGNVYSGSDGHYYNNNGDSVLGNLPNGVDIVGYDSETDTYIGSDGNHYNVDGDVVDIPDTPSDCDGVLLQYNNVVRISIDATDILGNQVNIGGDVPIGTSSISLPSSALIKEINRVIVRNISDGSSCGFGNLNIKGDVGGVKVGADIEIVDVDMVFGTYDICNCVFQACNKYADIVYNSDLPLGVNSLTSLDIGYFVLFDTLTLSWDGFESSDFPYCCGSVDSTEKEGGHFGKTDNKVEVSVDDECICDNLESINDNLINLSSIVEALHNLKLAVDDLVEVIRDKDFSITVEPSEVTVTNPVNNITVEPSEVTVTNPVNNITVSPCEPIVTVTNPVNNITVEPSEVTVTNPVNNITVEPCQPQINNVIDNDHSDIVNKLDELFKHEDNTVTSIIDDVFKTTYQDEDGNIITDDITDVIRKKDCENVFECIVEPVNMAYEGYGKYVSKELRDENGN